jgi:predicted nucleotidyltransferase
MKSKTEVVQTLINYFSSIKQVDKVSVFGSYSCNQQKEGSDVDIILSLNQSVGLFKLAGYKNDFENMLNMSVDLSTEKGISPYALPFILKDLTVIYERR